MKYNLKQSLALLDKTPAILRTFLGDLDDVWIHANEGEQSWSPIEILAHLILGEKTDWIPRTILILDSSSPPALDPFDMNAHLDYAKEHSMEELLSEFALLRRENIEALLGLDLSEEDLYKKAIHPAYREVTLKQHLAAWLVHDMGHIAQISRVLAKQYRSEVGPWVDYMAILNDRQIPSDNS